jgi:hypothetical protein
MWTGTYCRTFSWLTLALLLSGAIASAATVTGTVTNGTNNKPSAGDSVALIDVQAGMSEAATTTTNSKGQYSLDSPGMGAYLIRVTHQGGTYFIAAPQGDAPGNVMVYDVAARVDGVAIDADMLLVEAAGDMLRIHERYLVRNTSLPPRAQFSNDTFEIALPSGALLDGASATRPGGMATITRLAPLGQAGHYAFNIPIQPDQGEKETLFEVQYHLPYNGKFTLKPHPLIAADNLVVYVPTSMIFSGASGTTFQRTQEDPRVQTFVTKGIHPGQEIAFTISGEGQMPANAQGGGAQTGADGGMSNRPGGGLGAPIDTPDPLSKYKWWIVSAMTFLLAAGAAYFLRNRNVLASAGEVAQLREHIHEPRPTRAPVRSPAEPEPEIQSRPGQAALLALIKEEMFAIESEKLSGELSEKDYEEAKVGLQAVLKRALKAKAPAGSAVTR